MNCAFLCSPGNMIINIMCMHCSFLQLDICIDGLENPLLKSNEF